MHQLLFVLFGHPMVGNTLLSVPRKGSRDV